MILSLFPPKGAEKIAEIVHANLVNCIKEHYLKYVKLLTDIKYMKNFDFVTLV